MREKILSLFLSMLLVTTFGVTPLTALAVDSSEEPELDERDSANVIAEVENNDSPVFANTIEINSVITGDMRKDIDRDFFKLTVPYDGVLEIKVEEGNPSVSSGKWVVNLCSFDGDYLLYSSTVTGKGAVTHSCDVLGSTTYYVEVFEAIDDGKHMTEGASYRISVNLTNVDFTQADTSLSYYQTEYDGTEKTPAVSVLYKNTKLAEGVDYDVTYANNVEAGTATATITGKGMFVGYVMEDFEIEPLDMVKAYKKGIVSISIPSASDFNYIYDGTAKQPPVTVKYGDTDLVEGVDYEVEYSDNVNVGTAIVTVTGKGMYAGDVEKSFAITRLSIASAVDDGDMSVSLSAKQFVYDGNPKQPDVEVMFGDTTLEEGDDYTVAYLSNTNAGTGSVNIDGKGAYTGRVTETFTIDRLDIASAIEAGDMTISVTPNEYSYDGKEKKPSIEVRYGDRVLREGNAGYSVAYNDNVEAGEAAVVITGNGNYSGEASETFNIRQMDIANAVSNGSVRVRLDQSRFTYDGTEKRPGVQVTYGSTVLSEGDDYTLRYADNVEVGEATAIVVGAGNYSGEVSKPFTIAAAESTDSGSGGSGSGSGSGGDDSGSGSDFGSGGDSGSGGGTDSGSGSDSGADSPGSGGDGSSTGDNGSGSGSDSGTDGAGDGGNGSGTGDDNGSGSGTGGDNGSDTGVGDDSNGGTGNGSGDNSGTGTGGEDSGTGTGDGGSGSNGGSNSGTDDDSGSASGDNGSGSGNDSNAGGSDSGSGSGSAGDGGSNAGNTGAGDNSTAGQGGTDSNNNSGASGNGSGSSGSDSNGSDNGTGSNGGTGSGEGGGGSNSNSNGGGDAPSGSNGGSSSSNEPSANGDGSSSTTTTTTNTSTITETNTVYRTVSSTSDADTPSANTASTTSTTSSVNKSPMYRMYNPNSGEHFYTASMAECDDLKKVGWNAEGIGWYAPKTGTPVYRLYNAYAGEHHYTTSKKEANSLVKIGWQSEGIGWYSADSTTGVPVYRQYNPYQKACNHNYTTSTKERDRLIKLGWRDEGVGWYGVK